MSNYLSTKIGNVIGTQKNLKMLYYEKFNTPSFKIGSVKFREMLIKIGVVT